MTLRKFTVVLDCESDEQHTQAQSILNELSNTRVLTAGTLIKAYPIYQARQNEIRTLFNLVKTSGLKGLLSVQGATLLAKMARL